MPAALVQRVPRCQQLAEAQLQSPQAIRMRQALRPQSQKSTMSLAPIPSSQSASLHREGNWRRGHGVKRGFF
ncbi:hypothetical protein MDA_GLEAN10022893 [Myotis davidii]|uniref:Uncharacterized protein n=1 Tax=Myotis davidii TaxID=225400 RepID=L5M1I0_MYODS|nr:hypothetical protein MDA_GLEAN10022893 [Myotis davidii]